MRRRISNWRSFRNGFLLAGLPILAFAGADYVFAPPAATPKSAFGNRTFVIGQRLGETKPSPASRQMQHPSGAVVEAAASPPAVAPKTIAPESSLVASIQSELRRVGCYAGNADGSWTDRTRLAMNAFNDSVHVKLNIDQPDFILLTLLQGHSGKACSRSCGSNSDQAAQCVDKTIEARRIPPVTLAPRKVASSRSGGAIVSSGAAPQPIVTSWPASTDQPAERTSSSPRPEAHVAHGGPDQGQRLEPLPGRMSVGAKPSDTTSTLETIATAAEITPATGPAVRPVHAQPAPLSRPTPPSSPNRRRVSQTFDDISRNAP